MELTNIQRRGTSLRSKISGLKLVAHLFYVIPLVVSMLAAPAQANVVLNEDFNSKELDKAWNLSLSDGMKKNDWKYNLSKSNLVVTDILDRSINRDWSTVTLSRTFDPLTDFDINFAFSWDIGRGKKINRAVQTLSFNLYDTDNNLLSSIGYSDLNTDTTGSKFVSIAGMSPYSISANGSSGKENISLSRDGDALYVSWDNLGTFSGTSSGNLGRFDIQFSYSKLKGKHVSSFFGTESVDSIKLEGTLFNGGTPVAPEPVSSVLFITGGALLAGRLYYKRSRKE